LRGTNRYVAWCGAPKGPLFLLRSRSADTGATVVAQGGYSLAYRIVSQPAYFAWLNQVVVRPSSLLNRPGSMLE